MLHGLIEREEGLKAAALRTADAGDWQGVASMAKELQAVYRAILASGAVPAPESARWEGLLERWTRLEAEAVRKAALGPARAAAAAKASAPEAVLRLSIETAPPAPAPVPVSGPAPAQACSPVPAAKSATGVTLADVKGLEAAKQAVMDALVNPVRHPDIYRTLKIKNGKGLLLYGPPGTGKTMFARAVAGELGLPFIYKKMSELKDKYVGESEKNVSRLFEEAQSHKRCVVFLDECESILRKRGNQKINVVEQFLAELDGFGTRRDVQLFLILATNRPWLIDSAVTRSGRIGLAVHVGLPDAETRRAIVSAALEGVPLAPDVDVESIVARTEGYSGAELHHGDGGGVCDEAAMEASRRWVKRREPLHPGDPEWNRVEEVTAADFETALEKVVPVSRKDPEIVRKNREFSLSNAAAGEDGEPEAD